MQRKILIAVASLVLVTSSVAAYAYTAWTLSSRVLTGGGAMQIGGNAPMTSASGPGFANFTTSKLVPVTFIPDSGYQVSSYSVNGSSQPTPAPSTVYMGLPAFTPMVTGQSINVSFAKIMQVVTANTTPGGSVNPTGTTSYQLNASVSYVFTPSAGGSVLAISGAPVGSTFTDNTTGAAVTLPYQGAVRVTFIGSATPVTLYGKFVNLWAQATGPSVTIVGVPANITGTATTYDGSDPSTVSYAWTQIGGPAVAIANANSATATFTAATLDRLQFQLLATDSLGGTATATLSIDPQSSAVDYARSSCLPCHIQNNVGVKANVFGGWSSAKHSRIGVVCWNCHIGANTASHPGISRSQVANICATCHTSFSTFSPNPPGHFAKGGTNGCVNCHDPHSTVPSKFLEVQAPHFNNISTGAYPASYVMGPYPTTYVRSQAVCANCHSPNNDNAIADQNRAAWADSAHAATKDPAWSAYDFKTIPGCVRCHTATGFVAYSTGKVTAAWGSASVKTKEVLSCNGCHKPDFSVRVLTPYSSAQAFSFQIDSVNTVSVPYKNANYSTSNVCIPCHSGTINGEVVKKAFTFASFTAVSRLGNHFKVGAGILDNNIGYEFDGTPAGNAKDFNKQNTWHSGIGIATLVNTGSDGPCVGCHMSSPGASHSFSAVFKNTSGAIIDMAAPTFCAKCHPSDLGGGTTMTVDTLLTFKNGFTSALAALKAQLFAKGINPDAPAGANWGATQTQRANNAGAYYNYLLLKNSDVGAYAHNPTYAKRLIQFSIDWLDDGTFNGSAYSAINALNIPADTRAQAITYLGVDPTTSPANCFRCHQAYYN